MSTFNENDHPRGGTGQFAAKPAAPESGVALGAKPAEPAETDVNDSRQAVYAAASAMERSRRHFVRTSFDLLRTRFPGATSITTATGTLRDKPTHIVAVEDEQGQPLWKLDDENGLRDYDDDVEACSTALATTRILDRVAPARRWNVARSEPVVPHLNAIPTSEHMRHHSYDMDSIVGRDE